MSRRPIEIDDLYTIRLLADPNISPDGRRVAYVVTTVERETNGYTSAIWIVECDGSGEPYRFTSGKAKDTSPRWSPNGMVLAFLSDRAGKNQVYVMCADGGEPWQLTDVPNGAGEIAWSPDSRSILYVTKVEPEQSGEAQSDVRVINMLKYKLDGEGFLDRRKRKQVFIVDIDEGEPRQMTHGDWDSIQPAISSDGRWLACASNRSEHRDDNTLSDIWLTDLHNGETRRITNEDGQFSTPSWSPDGQLLAYIGHSIVEPYGQVRQDELYLWDMAPDETRRLTSELDREPNNSAIADARYGVPTQFPLWSTDSRHVYTLISDQGDVHIYRHALNGSSEPAVIGTRDIQSFSLAADGTIAFCASTMQIPTEVFICRTGGSEQRLTRTNDAFMEGIELGEIQEVRYESDRGVEIDGWLLRPPNFNPRAKYPAIIEIHGGPHGMYGSGFFHELHVLAARGYVVLYTNPRGSTGYGQEFVAGAMGDWGGADYRDVMAGVPFLETLDYVDPARLGITGGSYGGYMTNWIVGQTNRFKAAVTQRSTCNRISAYGTSDLNMTYNDWEFGGNPYDNPDFYMERSPLTYVKNVTTPLLILHSENDLRCPISQAEELFVALKKLGKEVEFVRFPDESHNLSRSGKPAHRVERLERIAGWFDRHV